ncbi:MAG: adenine/guanine/hypoxanthine permease [Clostridiales bacterium]|jgi:AGZA family xanthine/uracil permease-like MFS transporter|nr:adenine/guanine/hypoxanthine permease [Clostridiales bacterium]MDN5298234.1 adenine/guanine/hypoxanthine permease [Clostridiales bacterium]
MEQKMGFFEKTFKLKAHGTDVRTEIVAGITTFMTMAYILIVNPIYLEPAGMDFLKVFTATALSAIIATLIMGLYANLPFALAPGMGLNAYFTYTVVIGMNKSFEFALTAVFLEGIVFLLLTFFNVREAIINAIPINIKKAISVGIGLFIAFIGLANAGVIVHGDTILALGNITSGEPLLAIIGLIIAGFLLAKGVKGALFIAILLTTIIGIPMGITTLPTAVAQMPTAPYFFNFAWQDILSLDMLTVLFVFLFVDMFDTVGTLVGVSTKSGMLTPEGKVPNVKRALFADAVGTTLGAILGTSTVTTYVESASGVAEGGRTGLTSVTTAALFGVALFLSPLFVMIPSAATAPALVMVGLFMMSPIKEIDFEDFTEAIPAFFTFLMMPLAYSISEGIVFGILSYVILKALTGRAKEVTPFTWVIALLFLLKFFVS